MPKLRVVTMLGFYAETGAIIKRLAEIPCPICNGEGTCFQEKSREVISSTVHELPCWACHGIGARFYWLRSRCSGRWFHEGRWLDDDSHGSCGCHGKGWVPNYGIRLAEAIARAIPDFHGLRKGVIEWIANLPVLNSWETITPAQVQLDFWRAMDKAVSQ